MKKTNLAFILLTVLMIAAVPAFGQFASTTLSPASQSVEAGSSVSVDINWSIAYNSDPTRGIEAWLNFDPSVLQVVSVTSAGAPFSNEEINTFDNTAGTIDFKATGSAVNSGNYAIATIVFQAIAAGTSPINFSNVNQYFTYYGPYGVNGGTSGGSIEVTASVCEPTEQTFTILGANGSIGDIDPYSQSLPAGATEWQPVYLTGWHPWGFIPGTNSWVNFDPNDEVGLNSRTPYRIRFEVPADFSNPSMTFNLKADNRAIIWINDTYIDSVDGQGSPSVDVTVAEQALHPGLNEIRLTMVDWGGIVGFNYRIDVTMTSCEDITDAVLTPDEAAELNNAPMADAGPDQSIETTSATLDGSGSSDPDGNLLSYSWSENGTIVATGVNPTISLADGSHAIILTVSDGELSSTDEVIVTVITNEPPVAAAGADQSFECMIGSTDVTLDGSGSSDADGDNLTYSWSLGGTEVSTDASFTIALGGGNHTFTLSVSDGEASSSDEVTVNVVLDETAPELTIPGDITVSNDPGSCGAVVNFEVTANDDCDLASLVVEPASGSFFDVGTTEVTVIATDAAGNESHSSFEVTVEDTEGPTFAAALAPSMMWPPNHKYSGFDVSDFVISVEDNCSDLSAADVIVTRVTSDEAEDARGGGDGKTKNDIVINGTSIDLRAERQGGGNGRVYTIYMSVVDESGNSSTASAQVHVPHNNNGSAVDDGSVYEVTGSSLGKLAGSNENVLDITEVPDVFQLNQNYPNPFNPSTTFSYGLPQSGHVSLVVYDMRGSVVSQLVNAYQSAGMHTVHFNAADLPAGTYLYVLEANGAQYVKRMLLLK